MSDSRSKTDNKLENNKTKANNYFMYCLKFLGRHFVDIIVIVVLIVFILIEEFCFIQFKCFKWSENCSSIQEWYQSFCDLMSRGNLYINNIVSILCPVITTVLSISISVYSDDFFGVKLSTIRRFRRYNAYSLTGMIIIPILFLVLCVCLSYFDLIFTMVLANILSLAYCLYFLCRELPLLSKSDFITNKIVNNLVYVYSNSHKQNEYISTHLDDAKKMLEHVVYEWGIEKILDNYDRDVTLSVLGSLLSLSTDVIDQYFEGLTSLQRVKILPTHFANSLTYIKALDTKKHPELDSGYSLDDVNILGNSIETPIDKIGYHQMSDDYKYALDNIVFFLIPKIDCEGKFTSFLLDVSNNLLTQSLKNNELWYVERIDGFICAKSLSRYLYDKNYSIFISIYLFYMSRQPGISDSFKKQIDDFVCSKFKRSIYNRTSFNNMMSEDDYLKVLEGLLSIFNNSLIKWSQSYDNNIYHEFFDDFYIIAWWTAGLFCFTREISNSFSDKLEKVLITKEQRELFSDAFSWLLKRDNEGKTNNAIINDVLDYFKVYGLTMREPNLQYCKKHYLDQILTYVNRVQTEKNLRLYYETLAQITDDNYIETIHQKMIEYPFYCDFEENNVKRYKFKEFSLVFNCAHVWELYDKENSFKEDLNDLLLNSLKEYPKSIFDKMECSMNTIEMVIGNLLNSITPSSFVIQNPKDEKLYRYNLGSIKLHISIDDDSIYRNLTTDEIESVANHYSEDGNYFIYECPNFSDPFFLTKDELVATISKERRVVNIKFRYYVEFDFKNMFKKVEDK